VPGQANRELRQNSVVAGSSVPVVSHRGLPQSDERRRANSSYRAEDSKLAALKAYRRAKGLCFKCGERWNPNHTCSSSVPLHVVEEMWAITSQAVGEIEVDGSESQVAPEDEEVVLAVSIAAASGSETNKTIRLWASIHHKQMLVLVDSGSSASFMSLHLMGDVKNVQQLPKPLPVKVADGRKLWCDCWAPQCPWLCGGITFHTDFKFLPLSGYDIILGMDWLEGYSPMSVYWAEKKLEFCHQGQTVQLQGIQPKLDSCIPLSDKQLRGLLSKEAVEHMFELRPTEALEGDAIPEQISTLLEHYQELFLPPQGLPPKRMYDHSIPLLPGATPFRLRPYRYTPQQKDEIEKQIKEMLSNGIIQQSSSPFSSPVLLVKKKDGEWRLCVDYRKLNAYTVKNKFPMPVFDEITDELSGAAIFTKLDHRAGYHQIRIQEGEEFKTAFQTHNGHYEYKVMPFGLTGAPATFQDFMNHILSPLLRQCVVVFLDDILVYSDTLERHIEHLEQVFRILQQNQLKLKLSKCKFAQDKLEFLGHMISANGIATDPSKVAVIKDWPIPSSVKEIRSFLGIAGYYRRFVAGFGIICKPLTNLLKKDQLFVWTSSTQQAFDALKEALIHAPVLAIPNFTKEFVIETDASGVGIGAVLQQEGHPIAFISKALGQKNLGLSTYEKECLAILFAIEHWRPYLQHAAFVIKTDQQSLIHLDDQRVTTPWQQKALTKLMGLNFTIVYKKGVENKVADALSRRPNLHCDDITLQLHALATSSVVPSWLAEVTKGYESDEQAKKLLQSLATGHSMDPFTLTAGIIRHKGRVWLGHDSALQLKVMTALHDSAVGGHSGFPVTYRRIKSVFSWPGMKSQIKEFVSTCSVCLQAKPDRSRYPGLLLPLPIPEHAWQVVTMDFISGLPTSHRYNCIMVVVDKFSKYAHFLALAHPFTALTVAKLYFSEVYKLHGLPSSIVSDRDPIFTSKLWQELFRLAGTKLCLSSAYHPQSDGQTERVNQCVEAYLRCFVHACPRQWYSWLSLAEFWYNTSYHTSLGKSPFEVLYGHTPSQLGLESTEQCSVPDLSTWLQTRQLMLQQVKLHLQRAQDRMKKQADKGRVERVFAVGDKVFLKLQPYCQKTVEDRAVQKLAFRFFGPFEIIRQVNSVAYELALPAGSSVHPVFHVSQLKSAVGARTPVCDSVPDLSTGLQVPEEVLNSRLYKKGNKVVTQLLVKWSSWPDSLATWEDEQAIKQRLSYGTGLGSSCY
jgi:transposase InsO family protein